MRSNKHITTFDIFRLTVPAAIILFCFSIAGCGDGGGNTAPDDISGTWSGTVTAEGNLFAIAVVLQQTGSDITGNYATNFGGSTINGTLEGTYANKDAALAFNYSGFTIANASLTFNGNKAKGEITSFLTDDVGRVNLSKE